MREKWNVGDACEVHLNDGWAPGVVHRLYKHFVEVRIDVGNIKANTLKAYPRIRKPNAD